MANTKKVHDAAMKAIAYLNSLSPAELRRELMMKARASRRETRAFLRRLRKFEERSANTRLLVKHGLPKGCKVVGKYELVMSNMPTTVYTHPDGGVITVERRPEKRKKRRR